MSGPVISFTGDIIASAKARCMSLDHTDVAAINANLNTVATFEGGSVTFALGGRAVDLGEAVEAMSTGYGKPVTKPETSGGPNGLDLPANATATERAVATNAAIRTGADARKRDQASALVRTYGNPWKTGNATHRAYVQNVAPDMASRLRREAGASS